MAYRVDIARSAEAELEELSCGSSSERLSRVPRGSTASSGQFFHSTNIRNAVRLRPKSIDPDHPVRVLSHGRKPHVYRVFFTVDHNARVVRVVHVRRGGRQRPTATELKGE